MSASLPAVHMQKLNSSAILQIKVDEDKSEWMESRCDHHCFSFVADSDLDLGIDFNLIINALNHVSNSRSTVQI